MIFKKAALAIAIYLMSFYQTVSADVGADIQEGTMIEVALNDAVNEGFTIDQAVTDAITANPKMAKDIVAAAIAILGNLPDTACAIIGEKSAKHTADRDGCSQRIMSAAIMAGADPAVVTEATAAGAMDGPPHGVGGPKGPGAPRYFLGRP